ncbi:MAG: hypothetical protein AAB528_04165 [Chloroflexota bacterium]
MTIPEKKQARRAEKTPPAADSPMYQVSFERLAQLKRSAVQLIAARRPPSCPSRGSPDHELSDPQELVREVAYYCADEEGFIRSELPVQEMIFRVLLTRSNEPTALRDLHYEVTERWSTPIRPINLTEKGLGRILDADTYYGFSKLVPDSREPETA